MLLQPSAWFYGAAVRTVNKNVINMVLALLNRLTPQLSIFVVGFPLTLTFGMLALLLIDETLAPFFERLMSHGFEILSGLLQALV